MTDERADSPVGDRLPDPKDTTAFALTAPFLAKLPVTGVAISVFDQAGRQSTIAASDPIAARLDEVQFDLGDGPHWVALRSAQPVLIPELTSASLKLWPAFADAIHELPVGAFFAFPMTMGAAIVGVVDLYCSAPTTLNARDFGTAIALVARIASAAVREALQLAKNETAEVTGVEPAMRREIHQATGMILAQLNVSATEALLRLRAHAFVEGRSVHDIAREVVAKRLDFSALND
jgi:GAF domain-containing protein